MLAGGHIAEYRRPPGKVRGGGDGLGSADMHQINHGGGGTMFGQDSRDRQEDSRPLSTAADRRGQRQTEEALVPKGRDAFARPTPRGIDVRGMLSQHVSADGLGSFDPVCGLCHGHGSKAATSPPERVPRARNTDKDMLSGIKWTEPSTRANCTPPV